MPFMNMLYFSRNLFIIKLFIIIDNDFISIQL